MPQSDITSFAPGPEPSIQGAHSRIILNGGEGRIPQIHTDQVIAFVGHVLRSRRQRLSERIHAGSTLLGKNAEVADQVLGGELLQYLRNNDLDPTKSKSDPKDIIGT